MNTKVSLRRAIRIALGGPLALSTSLSMTSVFAQGAADEVVVTGSRIARSGDFASPSPVQTVDRDNIEKSGYDNLQQLIAAFPDGLGPTLSPLPLLTSAALGLPTDAFCLRLLIGLRNPLEDER